MCVINVGFIYMVKASRLNAMKASKSKALAAIASGLGECCPSVHTTKPLANLLEAIRKVNAHQEVPNSLPTRVISVAIMLCKYSLEIIIFCNVDTCSKVLSGLCLSSTKHLMAEFLKVCQIVSF